MKRNSKIGLIIIVLMLSVGFAAVATNLIINNTVNIGINPADFDIYFSFAKAEQGGTATISDDKKTITYSTKTLTTVGEKAKLDYTVTNNSSNYDADVTVIWNAVDTISGKDYSEYYTVTRTGFESGVATTVEAKTSVDGTIEITLIKPILEEVEIESSMTYDAAPQERTLKKLGSPLRRRTLPEMILRDNVLRSDVPDFTTTEPRVGSYTPEFADYSSSKDMSYSGQESMYFTYAESYTFDYTSKKFTLVNPSTCRWGDCYNDLIGKYIVNTNGSSSDALANYTDINNIYLVTDATNINTLYTRTGYAGDVYTYENSGFYSMNVTNGFGGQSEEGTTYYFRGKIENNYVQFGESKTGLYKGYNNQYPDYPIGQYSTYEECMNGHAYSLGVDYCETVKEPGAPLLWRVIRINEDGTVRLIFDYQISEYATSDDNRYSDSYNDPMGVYYSDSILKNTIEEWYDNTITGAAADRVASGNYFCEAARVLSSSYYGNVGNSNMTPYQYYTPDLSCPTDGNGKGLVNNHVALATYDEVVMAGGYVQQRNEEYYINDYKLEWWTMSPAGASIVWRIQNGTGHMSHMGISNSHSLRPVINIKADTYAHGTGTKDDPYVIELD